jgi:hypothetical protein
MAEAVNRMRTGKWFSFNRLETSDFVGILISI